jgi:hypothetical protein
VIEALVSLLIVSTGLIFGAEKLKPVSWSEWAKEVEKKGDTENPYARLEERYSFWDVRVSASKLSTVSYDTWSCSDSVLTGFIKAKRKEFADWLRSGTDAPLKG